MSNLGTKWFTFFSSSLSLSSLECHVWWEYFCLPGAFSHTGDFGPSQAVTICLKVGILGHTGSVKLEIKVNHMGNQSCQYKVWKLRLSWMYALVDHAPCLLSHTWRCWCYVDSRERRWLKVPHLESSKTASSFADFNLCLLIVKPCVTAYITVFSEFCILLLQTIEPKCGLKNHHPSLAIGGQREGGLAWTTCLQTWPNLRHNCNSEGRNQHQFMLHDQYLRGLITPPADLGQHCNYPVSRWRNYGLESFCDLLEDAKPKKYTQVSNVLGRIPF